jgi:hypothetical protein
MSVSNVSHPWSSRCVALMTVATLLVACASILEVDKTYILRDQGDAGIRCATGAVDCTPGTQECCLGASGSLSCVQRGTGDPCPGGTDIACDDKADCAGKICCIQLDTNSSLLGTSCFSMCPASQPNGSWLELCTPGAGTCTTGSCQPLSSVTPSPPLSPGWFSACQP